jgi:hypothetical protein
MGGLGGGVRQVEALARRYRAHLDRRGIAEPLARTAERHYREAQGQLNVYQRQLSRIYDEMCVPLHKRSRLNALGLKLYRICRLHGGQVLLRELAIHCCDQQVERAKSKGLHGDELAIYVRALVESWARSKSAADDCRLQIPNGKSQSAEDKAGLSRDVLVKVARSALDVRV